MMPSVSIERGAQASRPLLACIHKVVNTLPKTSYVVYYRNHMQEDDELYKNIEELRELFVPSRELHLKVINFQKGEDSVVIKSDSFECSNSKVLISFKYLDFSVTLEGAVINQSESNEGLVNLSLSQKKGYDEFYKYRKKYKTLQNITKKIDFQIDHRIKVIISAKEYQFDLEDKKKEHYFLNLASFQQTITIVLEETTSIEDFIQVEQVEEVDVDMSCLRDSDCVYNTTVKFSHKFEVTFFFNLIKNQNLSSADFVSIRVLETSAKCSAVKIGTQQSIHLPDCLKIQPLIGSRFFDYEWGYLNQNISQIDGSIYEYLNKITKSVPQYAHFSNQEMVDLKFSNFLVFEAQGTKIRVPIVYILKGFNYIECQKYSLKFFVDSSRLESKPILQKINRKRIYEMNVLDIWNTNKLNNLLDKSNTNEFVIKIINEDTYYHIPFTRKIVKKSDFRKESKQLAMRNEVSQIADGKYISLQNHNRNKDQLIVVQSSLNPFYLITITSSSTLSVQVIISGAIALEGSLSRDKIYAHVQQPLIYLLTSLEGSSKMGVVFTFTDVTQQSDSAATYYNFRHRLYFAEGGESEEVTYDIEVEFEKESNLKSLRSKISPSVKREGQDYAVLRQFTGSSGVFRKEETLTFTLRVKKMHFNAEMNYFDNEALMTKTVTINPTAQLLKTNNLMMRLEKESFEGIQFDLYDLNVKKRMKYYLQIYAQKSQFLDYKDSSYKIKIPPLLWKLNNPAQTNANFQICTHLNRKNKNKDKHSFPPNFTQEIILDHYNYNDGVSIIQASSMAYSKFIKAFKLKCDILKDKIGWSPQGEWYFSVLCFPSTNFYFLTQRMFDPYEEKKNKSSSKSNKTVSRQRSNRSDKHKIDPLAKTISNLDLFKLKQKKNQLIAEGRQLTARYVKRQEKIVQLTKKISDYDEALKRKQQQQTELKADRKKIKKENTKMKEFYRSICECGARNPQFNGYCDVCLKKLKESYEIYSRQYKQMCYEYEKMVFDKFNKKEKIEKMKKKIVNMRNEHVIVDVEDTSPQLLIKDLQQKNLKKSIEQLEVELFDIDEQQKSLVITSNWQMGILEQKIGKEDEIIYRMSQQYDSLRNQLTDLLQQTKYNNKNDNNI